MKQYNFSKDDLDYLAPIDATRIALDTAIKVYIINVVFPRLGLKQNDPAQYDIRKGTISLYEEGDLKKGQEPKQGQKPVVKPTQPTQQPQQQVKTKSK